MGQSTNFAAMKDAQIKLREEECAAGMGHIAMQMMNLLHLDHNSNRLLQLDPNPMSMLLDLPAQDKEEVAFPLRWPSSVKKSMRFKLVICFDAATMQTLSREGAGFTQS